MNKKKIFFIALIIIGFFVIAFSVFKYKSKANPSSSSTSSSQKPVQSSQTNVSDSLPISGNNSANSNNSAQNTNSSAQKSAQNSKQYATNITMVGPGGNISSNAPGKKDFTLFAIPVPGILSRSGQPSFDNFKWLKDNGWKSVIDLRQDGEKNDATALDSKISGFNDLGLTFLSIPIKDSTTPSDAQADQFLNFVTNPQNQPAHVHCAAGIGRTGLMVALYRYSVQSWPMDKAIQEAGLYTKNMNRTQQDWLLKWAQTHDPGSYAK